MASIVVDLKGHCSEAVVQFIQDNGFTVVGVTPVTDTEAYVWVFGRGALGVLSTAMMPTGSDLVIPGSGGQVFDKWKATKRSHLRSVDESVYQAGILLDKLRRRQGVARKVLRLVTEVICTALSLTLLIYALIPTQVSPLMVSLGLKTSLLVGGEFYALQPISRFLEGSMGFVSLVLYWGVCRPLLLLHEN